MPLDRDLEHAAAARQPNLPEVVGVDVTATEAERDRAVACPACYAAPGHPCTTPTETGRRDVKWTHSARHDARIGWT